MTDGISLGGWLFTQCALLFATYGLGYSLPWWVLWFPSIALPIMLLVAFLLALVAAAVKK